MLELSGLYINSNPRTYLNVSGYPTMNFNFTVVVLAITVGVICNALPFLRKSKTNLNRQSKWEDFFIENPNLNADDFHLEEIWNKKKVSSSQGWSNCDTGSSSIVQVQSVQVYPNPPQKGESFTVTAKYYLSAKVNSGSANIYIAYKKIVPIIKTTMKVCKLVGYFGESCPLSAGTHTVTYSSTFPSYVPSGYYTGKVTASDSSGNKLVCIKLEMTI